MIAAYLAFHAPKGGGLVAEMDIQKAVTQRIDARLANFETQLNSTRETLRQATAALVSIAGGKGTNESVMRTLDGRLSKLDTRLAALEEAIMTNPSKALALPLLRKDVDTMAERYRTDISVVRDEVGRVYTLTQWFIGLMFTIAIGVFTLAIGNLRRAEPKTETKAAASA